MKWFRRIALGLSLLIIAAFLGLFVNALRFVPKPRAQDARLVLKVGSSRVAEHLGQAIRFATISHQDPAEDDRATFAALRGWLERMYPFVHATFERELIGGDALVYRWPGSDAAAKPVLLMAHQDVVPVEPGTETGWTHPPFSGTVADGYVWGRGAIDDKAMLVALFEACESLLQEGFVPARTLYIVSGFDEEVGGHRGAKRVAEEFARRSVRFAWVLDEGSAVTRGVVPFVKRPVVSVAVGEKGYLSIELIAHAEGGHSSMPPKETAISLLAHALGRLEDQPFAPHFTEPLRDGFAKLAGEVPILPRMLLANLWLTEPLLAGVLATSTPASSAAVRTTIAPTMLAAGVKDNVLPSAAKAVVNFRIQPGETAASVIAHTREAIADARVEITPLERTALDPAPLSDTHAPSFRRLQTLVEEFWPDAVFITTVVSGGTDARFLQPVSDAIYHFTPWNLDAADLKRIHGSDERVSVEDLGRGVEFFRELVRRELGGGTAQPVAIDAQIR
jgi:carboxypeptidase PM20D1